MARNFRVDSEFKNFITPLSTEEYKALEESILREGCRDKLILWGSGRFPVLVDGHNRLKICEEHQIPYETMKMDFEDYQEVMQGMITNQLARRNVTDEQRKYLIGQRMANEKKEIGRPLNNSDKVTELSISENHSNSTQNEGKQNTEVDRQNVGKPNTSEKIATEYGISARTVERNQDYAQAVDTIAENLGEDIKTKILSSEIKLTDKDTKELAKQDPEVQSKVINLVETKQAKNLDEAKQILSPEEEWLKEEYKKIDKEHDNHRLVVSLINEVKFRKIDEKAVEDYINLVAVGSFRDEFIENCDRLINKLNDMKMYYSNLNKIRRVK